MHRGLTTSAQERIGPVLARIRAALLDFPRQVLEFGNSGLAQSAGSEILRQDWPKARETLKAWISLLKEENERARAAQNCELADRLLVAMFMLQVRERLCASLEEWHLGHFGNAWCALATAQIGLSVALSNGGGALARKWHRLVSECEALFPRIVGSSFGAEVLSYRCSICDQDLMTCEHIPGRVYCGALCVKVVEEIEELHEISLVKNPAQPEARVTKIGNMDVHDVGLFWDDDETAPSWRYPLDRS